MRSSLKSVCVVVCVALSAVACKNNSVKSSSSADIHSNSILVSEESSARVADQVTLSNSSGSNSSGLEMAVSSSSMIVITDSDTVSSQSLDSASSAANRLQPFAVLPLVSSKSSSSTAKSSVASLSVENVIEKPLVTPKAFTQRVDVTSSDTDCGDSLSPYTGSLLFPSKYEGSDAARDSINAQSEAEYLRLTATIKDLESRAARWSDQFIRGDLGARECALGMLKRWAEEGAFKSSQINDMGQSVRKWAVATIANSYLQMVSATGVPEVKADDRAVIEEWLIWHAYQIKEAYSGRTLDKVNNHDYWAAWAVMAVSVIAQDRQLFDWAVDKYYEAISQIDDNGYLPNELARETRALNYHNYALHPLSWLAVFANANDVELNIQQKKALYTLVINTVDGLQNPKIFMEATGHEQVVDGLYTSYNLAWMEVWSSSLPIISGMLDYFDRFRPMSATRMGGNVSELFGRR